MDDALLLWINGAWASPWLDALFVWLSAKVTFSFPLLALLIGLLALQYGGDGFKLGLILLLVVVLGDAFGALLKAIIEQPRPCLEFHAQLRHPNHVYSPCEAESTGMPSNHALNFFATFAFLSYTLRSWRWGMPLAAIAVGVAISRVYLGAHYPSQVVAGAIIGILFGLAMAWTATRWVPFVTRIRNTNQGRYSYDVLQE